MITGNEQFHPVVFPGLVYGDGSNEPASIQEGINIRQHFAAMAMQGLCASVSEKIDTNIPEILASWSVRIADALIDELNKTAS